MNQVVLNNPKAIATWVQILNKKGDDPVYSRFYHRNGEEVFEIVPKLPKEAMDHIDQAFNTSRRMLSNLSDQGELQPVHVDSFGHANCIAYQVNVPLLLLEHLPTVGQYASLIQMVYDEYNFQVQKQRTKLSNTGLRDMLMDICRNSTVLSKDEVKYVVHH